MARAVPRRPLRRCGGFTLLEVLVALAVFAVGITALVQAGAQRAEQIGYLRDRTLASWIATDRMAELRLEREWPSVGTRSGEVEMAGRRWRWQAHIGTTPNESIRDVEVEVFRGEGDQPIARVTGYLGDPADTPWGPADEMMP